MNELSLAVSTPSGLAVLVGCSHPGVEKILAQAATIDRHLYTAIGGFHLVVTPEEEVRRVAEERFGERFDRAGVGASLPLP